SDLDLRLTAKGSIVTALAKVRAAIKGLVVVIGVAAMPASVFAQPSIAGSVKDSSGGALPGVTVEATSPVLIERVRSVVTDASGQYAIVDLRPGTFTVTFTLPGFNVVTRAGVELTGSFTATANAQLSVGGMTETVTVTADSSLIDLRSSKQPVAMTSEIVSRIPTGRSLVNLGVLVP